MCLSGVFILMVAYTFAGLLNPVLLLRTAAARAALAEDERFLTRTILLSLYLTVPIGGSVKLLQDWFGTGPPYLCVNRPQFAALALLASLLGVFGYHVRTRVEAACGQDAGAAPSALVKAALQLVVGLPLYIGRLFLAW